MPFSFRRRAASPNARLLDRLHTEIVAAVRQPVFYLDYGVPDSFEGRFELMSLHAGLVLRRFSGGEAPGPAVAQDLVDAIFAKLEADLREAGVGDITVPKRMKKLAEAFLGRGAAYDAALRGEPAGMIDAVSRNVFAGRPESAFAVSRMARYIEAAAASLAATSLPACLSEPLPFPDPRSITV